MKSASRMPDECEQMLHGLISRWWSMERAYIGMGAMCATDKNYLGFHNCFQLCSIRTRRCMEKMIQFLIMRGGSLRLTTVEPSVHIPQSLEGGVRKFLELSLKMETDMEKLHSPACRKYVTVQTDEKIVKLQLDTASDITIISVDTWRGNEAPKLTPTNNISRTASGSKLRLIGQFNCKLQVANRTGTGIVYVTDCNLNLLGMDWIDKLNLSDRSIDQLTKSTPFQVLELQNLSQPPQPWPPPEKPWSQRRRKQDMLREGFLLAQSKGDITTCEFIESGPLRREVRLIKWCIYHLTGLERCDNDYLYDRLAMSPIIEAWYKRVVSRPMNPFEMALTMSTRKPDNCSWTWYTNCTCGCEYHRGCLCKINTKSSSALDEHIQTADFFVELFDF
ncbi:hypothetical protein EG68_08790 [Paragonimus skrjabini miyazakii]|uniref:Peptidase A2 domain-containing protein n=1 Tax=Paragonimus skrjabini miyazakii TaxID=59628 RepID=A0A8S9YRU2_9TREM|nr:hypothetical protein EG68_08790 [Paragonimus skrjabini miyazakii]